jgi:hypothetical protein
MAETQIWPAYRICQAHGGAPAVSDRQSRRYRAGARLWALLHAPALLRGTAGGPGDVTFIEDDRRRLAARQAR